MKFADGVIRSQVVENSPRARPGRWSETAQGTDPELGATHAFLAALLTNSCDPVLVLDECAQLCYANAASERILGLWSDEMVGRNLLEFVHPDDVAPVAGVLMSSLDGTGSGDPLCVRVGDRSSKWHELELFAKNLTDNPAVGGILINARYISDGQRSGATGVAAQESFRQAFQRSPIGMAITTLEGSYVRVNQALCDLLDTTPEQLLASSVLETTHSDDLRKTVDSAIKLLDGGTASFSLEKRFLAAGNRPVWTRATTTLLRDGDENAVQFLTQVENIEERHQLIEQLRISALRDPLTGLANRAGLTEYLSGLPEGLAIGVVAVDLDRFKVINDSAGHAVGDEVLRAVAKRISGSIRSGDHAARTGGDEFLVVLAEPRSREELVATAKRLISEIQSPISVEGLAIAVGASAGIAAGQAGQAAELMVQADHASYRAKRAGLDIVDADASELR